MHKLCSLLFSFVCFLVLILTGSCAPNSSRHYSVTPQQQYYTNPYMTPPKRDFARNLIVIDAGHGGEDIGTRSHGLPRYQEKTLNLSTAFMLKSYLQEYGYHVIMTRTDDTFIPLDERAAVANRLNPKLFVSVHYNSAPSTDAEGIEVFYYRNNEDQTRMQQSKQLAQSILNRVIRNTDAKSRGVKHGNFAVIRETTVPAVLIEGGFLTNTKEMEKLKDAEYLKKLALGIAQGIRDFLNTF